MIKHLLHSPVFNFCFDASQLGLLLALMWVSAVTQLVFPPESQTQGYLLWGWNYNQWQMAQLVLFGIVSGVTLLHLLVHWLQRGEEVAQPKVKTTRSIDGCFRSLYGIVILILLLNLLGFGYVAALLMIHSS